jgi:hypothetical protein
MGDIFSSGGGLPLMVSNLITRAWFILTFSLISSTKYWIASGDRANWCGPRLIVSSMSAHIHVLPVLVGHPNCVQIIKMAAAGCSTARPSGHIELRNVGLCTPHQGTCPSAKAKQDLPHNSTPHCRGGELNDGYPLSVFWQQTQVALQV